MAPKYLVVFHPVSAGQNGSLLGADEEEIVMLVFIVIDTEAQQIVAEKRYMVKPRTADINENVLSDQCRNEFGLTEDQVKRGELLETVIEQFHDWVERFLTTSSKVPFLGTVGTPVWPKLEDSSRYRNWIGPNIVLVCDGQLPLRQCFHPEVCNKSIDLPPYYFSFFDLRKEFCKAFNCEPVHGIKDMLSVLGKEPVTLPGDQGMAEAENMAVVVQGMLEKSYDFPEPEEIGVRLEPGICSRNDVVDSNCVVRARGLPWQSSDQDIARFFRGLNVSKGGVALCLSQQGRRNGEALCRFISQEHRDMALKRHKHHMGSRYIEVYRATGEDFVNVAGGNNNEAQAFLSRNGQVIVRMRGLPYDCTAKQVVEFFAGKSSSAPSSGKVKEEPMTPPSEPADESDAAGASDGGVVVSSRDSDSGRGDSQDEGEHESSSASDPNACHVLDGEAGVLFVKKTDGRATGDAFVMFGTEEDGGKALAKHRQCIGSRYIELFRSTTAEVQQILNRPVEPRAMDPSAQVAAAVAAASQPSLAVPPVAQLPLLPQQIITAGVRKDCIRLRGLPYEAQVENILEFLGEHAKRIAYRGVHMIYNAQQQPSGEAFIQMDSEQAAYLAASQKHYKNMTFGKKQRYIEVFQCSGQDMQLVLSGGVPQSTAGPAAGAGPALLSPGMLPTATRVTSPVPVSSPLPTSQLMSQSARAGGSLDHLVRGGATHGGGGSYGGAGASNAAAAAAAAANSLYCLQSPLSSMLGRAGAGYPGVSMANTMPTASASLSNLLMRQQMLLNSQAAAAHAAGQSSLQTGKRSFDQAFQGAAADQASLAKRHQSWSVAHQAAAQQSAAMAAWQGQPSAAAAAVAQAQAQAAAAGMSLSSLGVHGLPSHVLAYPTASHPAGLY